MIGDVPLVEPKPQKPRPNKVQTKQDFSRACDSFAKELDELETKSNVLIASFEGSSSTKSESSSDSNIDDGSESKSESANSNSAKTPDYAREILILSELTLEIEMKLDNLEVPKVVDPESDALISDPVFRAKRKALVNKAETLEGVLREFKAKVVSRTNHI